MPETPITQADLRRQRFDLAKEKADRARQAAEADKTAGTLAVLVGEAEKRAEAIRSERMPRQTAPREFSPTEQALRTAHELDGPGSIAAALAEVDRAADLVARLSAGPWRESWPQEMRAALRAHIKAVRSWRFLGAIASGEELVRIPDEKPSDVDPALVHAAVVIQGPRSVVRLVGLCEAGATRAMGLAAALEGRMDAMKVSYAGGSLGLVEFTTAMTPALADHAAIRLDAHRRRNACASVLARLGLGAPAALGDPHDLRTSIRESQVMCRSQDSRLTAMGGELLAIENDLQRLASEGAPAGRLFAEIEARRQSVVTSIATRKAELAAVALSTGTNLLERALAGEPAGLAELAAAVVALPKAFPDGLADRIVTMIADAAASAADVFAELL